MGSGLSRSRFCEPFELVEPQVLDLDGFLIGPRLSHMPCPAATLGRAVGPASGESSFGGGVGELSSMLEHDECLVMVGAIELFPEECIEEEPVESLRFGTA
jgi:hypothetical protein